MEKNPRYVEIDYAKYAPDIPEDQLEAYYGLPKHVQFCNECVMSNQKPNSCYEFEHTIKSIKKTMVIQDAKKSCVSCAMNTAKMTAAMTAWCPAPAARTAFMPLTS